MFSKEEIIACIKKIIKTEQEKWDKYRFSDLESLNPQELFEKGECYLRGIFAPLDFKLAYEHFEKSASLGCADGYYGLSYMYSYGHYVEKDLEKTHQLAHKAIELGSARAIDMLGVLYYTGIGAPVDKEKALELTTEAGKKSVPNATTNQGAYYGQKKEYEKAYELFEKGLLEGSLNSIPHIARYFARGTVVEMDTDFALELLNYGVKLALPQCLCMLADAYIYGGYGLEKDYNKAIKYLRLAEKKKYARAYSLLAICYLNGTGVPQDSEKADYYISLCIEEGVNPPDKLFLANKYLHSLSYIEGNKEKGFKILQEYKDSKDGYALDLLAECYARGIGTEVNFDMAKHYYERAYECGYDNAYVHIGDCYFKGRGVDFNLEKATEYYMKGKELGIPLAFTRHASVFKYIWHESREDLVIGAYEEAISHGCTEGMAELAIYLMSKPVSDRKRVLELLEESEKAGEGLAYFGLGKYYHSQYGQESKAKGYLEVAIGKGYTEACVYLAELYAEGKLSLGHEKNYVAGLYYYKMAKERGYKINLDNKIEEMRSNIGSDFLIEDFTLVKCNINSKVESLPYGIKVIGKEAFRGNLKMKQAPVFPASLERIEDRAFMECRKLKIIALPNATVDYVGADIFLNTFPRKAVYYHAGEPKCPNWNEDFDVIRRFNNGKVARLRIKRGKEKRYEIVGYKKNGQPKLKRIFRRSV
ncbi:MAG: SEL1-like repeat protein [Clostridia bacterium]|nr:SEL1-like repeat protein [Clostridia bacterium]